MPVRETIQSVSTPARSPISAFDTRRSGRATATWVSAAP
jgi:hypothetical protein